MPTVIRVFPALLATLVLPGCFSPIVDSLDSEGASSSGTDPSESSTGSTTDADSSSSGVVDSTGSTDTPPQITSFTVDGSTMPAEQQTAGMVAFDVDAVDDMGIDHVELYDGAELIATLDSSPWRADLLVTSADNGSHSYTAVAYDTIGQTDESNVVPMSVNVIGGELLELRQDIGDLRITQPLLTLPRISNTSPTDLLITAEFRENVPMDPLYGITALSYSDTLSLQWSDELLPAEGGSYAAYANGGKPAPNPSIPGTWLLGGGMYGQDLYQRAVYSIDETTQSISDAIQLGQTLGIYVTPVATTPAGDVVLSPDVGILDKRPSPDAVPIWSVPIGGGIAPVNHAFTDGDDIVITFIEPDCAPMARQCAQKLSADGTVLWTRAIPSWDGAPPASATLSPEGNLAIATDTDTRLLRLLVLDPDGNTVTDEILTEDSIHQAWDLSYDPQGTLLIAGDLRTDPSDLEREAWAARVTEQGDILWLQIYSFAADHGITGVTTTPSGKAFVVGWEDSFDLDFTGFVGRGWVAELAL